ncbi:export ABC transporter permease protein [Syntrophus aciditrophicus SB]|uniref:Transport permease protein n=1 Tax=Syntrophus aciditrophicus (strain SB) TaxID=56780 RepID=Q2LXB3_SYNAS|nr:export ABC transporter permease protein [Syntrophus aciditrophicus SB]
MFSGFSPLRWLTESSRKKLSKQCETRKQECHVTERIRQVVRKEFIELFRDKRMKGIVLLLPIIQLFVFGYAVTTDVNHVLTAIYDRDASPDSRELARRFEGSGYFNIIYRVSSGKELQELVDRGKVLCAIEIREGFAKDLARGFPTAIQVIVDGTDSNTASVAGSYASRIILQYGREKGKHIEATPVKLDVRARAWYNPDLRSRNYNVPGVIAILIMLICLLLTSMAIVREREIGTIEQLMVTPLRPFELMMGKTVPFALIGFFDMLLVTTVGTTWFNIPIKGSLPLLFLGTAIYLISVLGIGLFISTISRTQQQALMATFLFFAPAILLSGFMFPIENMPVPVQYITYLNPLRYILVIIRGIFLKGNGMDVLWPEITALSLLSLLLVGVSSLRFKKKIG